METKKVNLKKLSVYIVAIYVFIITAFYYVAGEQLYYRNSEDVISSLEGDIATPEITTEFSVKQTFLCEMSRITELDLRLATFARVNYGTVAINIWDETEQRIIWNHTIDVSNLQDSVVTEIEFEKPIGGVYGHVLSIEMLSKDAWSGNAVAPWYQSTLYQENMQLYYNGEPVSGVLCFHLAGQEDVWTGSHYWQLAVGLGSVIGFYLLLMIYKEKKDKKNFGLTAIYVLQKYRFLIKQLVARDFKTKYKRSALGMLWSFLNPLLTMMVQYFVFSTIFKAEIEHYPVYLLAGIVLFGFFSEVTGACIYVIVSNASLINKVYMPKYIYPVSKVLSSTVNLLISLLPLLLVAVVTKVEITKALLISPFILVCLMLFSLGIGFVLATGMVFFRDIQFIWSVISMVWMYSTPIFYPESILPEQFKVWLDINPLYIFIQFFRTLLIDGISPEPMMYVKCALFAVGSLLIGAFVFKKGQDKFVLYL